MTPNPNIVASGVSTNPREELARLEAKLAKIADPDIRSVLLLRMKQLHEEIAALPPEPEPTAEVDEAAEQESSPEEEEATEPPTREQLEQAEGLLRQAQVEKMRGHKQAVTDLYAQARAVAPTSWQVLTVLGDDAMERKRFDEARGIYARALKVSPKNIALERKHAEAVFRSKATVSVEDLMRLEAGESLFVAPEDATASRSAATILNAVLPGVGQIYLGYTRKGITLLVVWLLCLGAIALMHKDVAGLTRFIAGRPEKDLNLTILLPLFVAAVIYISALADLKGKTHRKRIDHPVPPVDLPFE